MGIVFALTALFAWGIGDFLIQRSARKFGDWAALFFIDIFGTIVLLPFVWQDFPALFRSPEHLGILLTASILLTFASVSEFEAMRVGKLSVIEPIYAAEVLVTVLLGTFIAREFLTIGQAVLVGLLVGSIFLVATKSLRHLRHIHAERGAGLALIAAIMMGGVNFLFGIGARETSPLMINWFASAFIMLVSGAYLTARGRWHGVLADWRRSPGLILSVSFFDNLAWVAYSAATLFLPIAIATGISESYVALAAMLGLAVNREKLAGHQKIGLVVAVITVVIIASLYE
ncbi:MAG: DMT family transporter [Patescibacteria group bacterium]